MTDFLTELFISVLNRSISAVFLIAAVLLLRLLLRCAPRWISPLLWGIVGVRLLLPFSIESALSLIPSAETVAPEILYDPTPTIHSGLYTVNSVVNPVISTTFAPTPGASVNPLQVWFFVGALVWLVGVLGMLLYLAASYGRIRHRVRFAVPREAGIYESDRIDTPFVLGLFRPRIYLPKDLPDADAVYVIAHEREHIRRRDHLIKPIGFVLLCIYWFNPLLWVAYVLLCRDIEVACDERVIRDMRAEARADYSAVLLACSIPRRQIAACPLAFGEGGVKARVKHILHYKRLAFWIVLAALLLGIAVAVCFLTDPLPSSSVQLDAHAFTVTETVYQSSELSGVLGEWEDIKHYAVTENMDLLVKRSSATNGGWYALGRLSTWQPTAADFDKRFLVASGASWAEDHSASALRRGTVAAWRLTTEAGQMYCLLQNEEGELYLAAGAGETLYQVVRLEKDISADTGMIALSGTRSVPLVGCRADVPITELATLPMYTLVIAPDAEDSVPFHIYCDGREQRGLFSIYDAVTLESLDYLSPSGLDPQTYLFQNARMGGEYIVTMRTGASDDYVGDLWCFIAVLAEDEGRLAFTTFYAYAGYSETAHAAMTAEAVNRNSEAYGNAERLTPLVMLESRADLDSFLRRMSAHCTLTEGYGEVGSFTAETAEMDDSFFADYTLLVAYILETSISSRHALEAVWDTDGTMEIRIERITRRESEEKPAGWFLGVCVPKDILTEFTDYDAYICAEILALADAELPKLTAHYRFTESQQVIPPSVSLFEDGTFSFTFSAVSSYIGLGTYEMTAHRLTLRTGDGDFVYSFWVIGDTIVFDATASSPMLWFSELYHGAVLECARE